MHTEGEQQSLLVTQRLSSTPHTAPHTPSRHTDGAQQSALVAHVVVGIAHIVATRSSAQKGLWLSSSSD
jgi:hypothetical protein